MSAPPNLFKVRLEKAQCERQPPAHAFTPFGTGQRACIGHQFAVHETLVVVSTLLHRYELVPDPDYRLRVQELIAFRPTGFTLGVRRR